MTYSCPVCGFDKMPDPPEDHNVCSSCGTEFGYHDRARTHAQLRLAWIASGAPWFSPAAPMPPAWDPSEQLLRAGLSSVTLGDSTLAIKAKGVEAQQESAMIAA